MSQSANVKSDLSIVPDPIPGVDSSLYYQVPNWAAKKAIAAKLTGADWCVWSYLQMLDPFGDRLVSCPTPEEIAKETSFSEKQVKRSLHKLEEMGFWEFKVTSWKGRNLATTRKAYRKDKTVQSKTNLSDAGQDCPTLDKSVQTKTDLSAKRQICLRRELEPLPDKGSKIVQTYSDLSSEFDKTQSDNPPLPPQWGVCENPKPENFSEEEGEGGQEEATESSLPETRIQNPPTYQKQNSSSRIEVPPGGENDSQFLASDTMKENIQAQQQIMAMGAMKGASHPDPDFLEFYRDFLSKCPAYKGRGCTSNHAKAALKRGWTNEPLRILAEAENWQNSKVKSSKTTQTRDVMTLSREERLAIAKAVQERKKAQQQAKGA